MRHEKHVVLVVVDVSKLVGQRLIRIHPIGAVYPKGRVQSISYLGVYFTGSLEKKNKPVNIIKVNISSIRRGKDVSLFSIRKV